MSSPKNFTMKVGSKAQVYHGTAERTTGGLKRSDLMQTNAGRIVSRKQHEQGKKAIQRLRNAGFVAKKGEFKLFRKGSAGPTHTLFHGICCCEEGRHTRYTQGSKDW